MGWHNLIVLRGVVRWNEGNRRNGGSDVLCPNGGAVERTGERGIRNVDCLGTRVLVQAEIWNNLRTMTD